MIAAIDHENTNYDMTSKYWQWYFGTFDKSTLAPSGTFLMSFWNLLKSHKWTFAFSSWNELLYSFPCCFSQLHLGPSHTVPSRPDLIRCVSPSTDTLCWAELVCSDAFGFPGWASRGERCSKDCFIGSFSLSDTFVIVWGCQRKVKATCTQPAKTPESLWYKTVENYTRRNGFALKQRLSPCLTQLRYGMQSRRSPKTAGWFVLMTIFQFHVLNSILLTAKVCGITLC